MECNCVEINESCPICKKDIELKSSSFRWHVSGWYDGSKTYSDESNTNGSYWVAWSENEETNMCDDSGTTYFDDEYNDGPMVDRENHGHEPRHELRRDIQLNLLPRIESAIRELCGDLDYNKVGAAKATLKEAIEVMKKMSD